MKNAIVMVLVVGCVFSGMSGAVMAANDFRQHKVPVVTGDMCAQPANWKVSKKFHYSPTFYCHKIKCVLVDRSGGVIYPNDPQKNTYWEKVDWTLSKHGVTISNQCQKVPAVADSKYCHGVANGPVTCAYQYDQHLREARS